MAGPRYIADPDTSVRTVDLDGLTALFHVPSGMTHILAPPAPQILDVLRQGAVDAAGLAERLSQSFEIEGGAEEMEARIAELEAAGLVRRS